MTIAATATQQSNVAVLVSWTSTDADPAAGFEITRTVNAGAPKILGTLAGDSTVFLDDVTADALVVGDVLEYTVEDLDTTTDGTATVTVADLTVPFTFAPVDPLADTIRYTTLAAVKKALNITEVTDDIELSRAIIAAEIEIDQVNAQAFPSTGVNPKTPGIPEPIRVWALDAAIAVYKLRDLTVGIGGSDDWLGAIDVGEAARRSLRRNPLALGYAVGFGVA